MALRVAVIGSKAYGDFLSTNRPEWDWQPTSGTVGEFYRRIEDGTVGRNTQVLVIDPSLYNADGDYARDESFEELVATMTPHALVGVIAFNGPDGRTPRGDIQAAVKREAATSPAYSAHFYWLDSGDILRSIETRMGEYVEASDADPTAADGISEVVGSHMEPVAA